MGGSDSGQACGCALNTVEAYTPSSNSWAYVAAMPTHRSRLGAATGGDGRLYAIGGLNDVSVPVNAVEAYAPGNNTWTTVGPLPAARYSLAVVAGSDGRIYAIGRDEPRGAVALVEMPLPAPSHGPGRPAGTTRD